MDGPLRYIPCCACGRYFYIPAKAVTPYAPCNRH